MNGSQKLPIIAWMIVLFVAVLGVADWISIQYMYEMQWAGNPAVVAQAFWLIAYFAIFSLAVLYHLFTKDWSETFAIITTFVILVMSGLEDIMFYLTRYFVLNVPMDECMNWFSAPINTVSKLMGETCVTPTSLFLNVAFGAIIAYFVYGWLVKQRW
jgi:hypothetical protein